LGSQEFKPWLAFTRVTYTQFTNQIKHLYQNQKAPINAKLLSKVLWNIDLIFTILLSSSWTENSFRFNKKYWRTWIRSKKKYKLLGEPSLKKKRENLGKIPKGGGGWKNRRKFPISIWEFWKPRGGSRFYKNVWIINQAQTQS